MSRTILHIDSSARREGSLSRQVGDYLAQALIGQSSAEHIYRDLSSSELPLLDEQKIQAYFTKPEARSEADQATLAVSDQLVAELKRADDLVIAAPMYNFSIAASLKAWIDLICRVGETFVYTDQGPQGLLRANRAFIVVSTGGSAIGGETDFVSPLLKQVCGFLGVEEVHIIEVSGSKRDPNSLIDSAKQQIDELLAVAA